MIKLKLGPLLDDKLEKLTLELPAAVFRDLQSYAELLTRGRGATKPIEPARLIVAIQTLGSKRYRGLSRLSGLPESVVRMTIGR
ncbi:DUF2274 domain-containing protein [Bradyrhizobium sp. WSM2254]|uniref:DUF2274 domain-containing protein n=1 Tax=Bradyrhizobium sp. WSM2254 TaxID=1188263 RepID=UPI0004837F6A|nr:DUF2274 domain-containing protein [Bradyrhizobium sp. WSM2254]